MALNGLKFIIDGLRSLNAHDEVVRIVEDHTDRITELQKEQLEGGIGRDGQPRSDEYAPLTKYLKPRLYTGLGAVIDRVTFFARGNLYQSLQTKVSGDIYKTDSPLPTYDKMVERIGEENYGLDFDQRFEFATTITLPEFALVLEEKTGLKI